MSRGVLDISMFSRAIGVVVKKHIKPRCPAGVTDITTEFLLTLVLENWFIGSPHPHQYEKEKQRP